MHSNAFKKGLTTFVNNKFASNFMVVVFCCYNGQKYA